MSRPLITLTTDFGARDPYVAAMKGVLLTACPSARIVDLSHQIGPQSVLEGALFLAASAPYFPPATIHVAVIDPGVGTERHPVAAAAGGHIFVCPDNGVLTLLLDTLPLERAHIIENPAFMRPSISATFHGRDIFAPAAARLAAGAPLQEAGPRLKSLARLKLPKAAAVARGGMEGEIIHIDHFGNCITNIHRAQITPGAAYRVQAGLATLSSVSETYGDARPGDALALIGSTDRLEIAIRNGNAAKQLNLAQGAPVTLFLE